MISCKLKDVCKLVKGKQIDTTQLAENLPFKYINGGVKESGYYEKYNTNGNTIIISEGGASCGYVSYITEKFWLGCHCYKLIDVSVDSKYLFYALKANQQRIMELRTGAAMPNIKKTILNELQIKISMDEAEQKQAVKNLDYIEHLLEIENTALLSLDELTKSRFIEMFGDPIINPFYWKKDKAEKHINVLSGYPFNSNQYVDVGVKICGGLIIMPGRIDWDYCMYWKSVDGYEDFLLQDRDIVMALDRPWVSDGFKIAMVDSTHLPALLIQRTARIRAIDINQYYLLYSFLLGGFDMHCNITGSLVPHISLKDIRSFELMLPPYALQKQFAEYVEQIDKSKYDVILCTKLALFELLHSQKLFFVSC